MSAASKIARWRMCYRVWLGTAVLEVALTTMEIMRGSPWWALVPGGIAVLLLALTAVSARQVARLGRQPDYDRIAAMEREIWGEAFSHTGT